MTYIFWFPNFHILLELVIQLFEIIRELTSLDDLNKTHVKIVEARHITWDHIISGRRTYKIFESMSLDQTSIFFYVVYFL
jgi:hypothetical protein